MKQIKTLTLVHKSISNTKQILQKIKLLMFNYIIDYKKHVQVGSYFLV